MAPEPISTAYFINPSHQSVCMCILPTVARQRLGRHVPMATNTRNSRRIVGGFVFCTVLVVSKESLRVCLYLPTVARQRLGRHVPMATNTRNGRRIVGGFVFCTVLVVSKESLRVCLCICLLLPGSDSVNTFPRQRRIVVDVVLYAVNILLKESKRLVLPITFCFIRYYCFERITILDEVRI
jgi:hypothetical protein